LIINSDIFLENILSKLDKTQYNYDKDRDCPYLNSTTHLSAHLHFGNISPREFYWSIKDKLGEKKAGKTLIEQLFWREFYMYIINYHNTDYSKKSISKPKMNNLEWKRAGINLEKWKSGKTGVPFVDAGMRELKNTGYMQNRLRMVVAMFLIHFLEIHWKEGEKWFAQSLVDYSYCNNFGGWVWCAGTEIYSNPYFRIFSISSQMERFDKNAQYVYKWCPELKDINPKHLYDWENHYKDYKNIDYPEPIIFNLKEKRKERIDYITSKK
jgi:deoxyribodipyrimidine photo-lyase